MLLCAVPSFAVLPGVRIYSYLGFNCLNSVLYHCYTQPTTRPLRGGWTRPPVGQMASPQQEGDLLDHASPHLSPLTSSLISPFHIGGALDWCRGTLLLIQSHPPAWHGPSPLIFPPLHPPLSHSSSTPRRSDHSGSQ